MTADELIEALQALPAKDRKLPITSYESSWLIELEPPRIGYRNSRRLEVQDERTGNRVIVL
jgi:hypothetical protein